MAKSLYEQLTDQIRDSARRVGVELDEFDPDFLLGVMTNWLRARDAYLDGNGVHIKLHYNVSKVDRSKETT